MRSNGLATILLMIPVLTVPALAIFGIPQFAPVVASPLDEGPEKDRESRVGNSARHSQDDLFGDVEGFGSEPPTKGGHSAIPRELATEGAGSARRMTHRSGDAKAAAWGDDLPSESDWPSKPRRPRPQDPEGFLTGGEPASGGSKSASIGEKSSRDRRSLSRSVKADDAVRVASAADMDQNVLQAGFVDNDPEPEKVRSHHEGMRSRASDPRQSRRGDTGGESLTWQSAVERLNELQIRNFRLEPGTEAGQFVFICSYTPTDAPRVSYRFEAGADEPLKAVEKVLEQIIEWQQRR
jgi:hypothetical protein